MNNHNFTMYAYKADKRTKTGERLISTRVYEDTNETEMAKIVAHIAPITECRYEYFPTTKTVKNLMTGKDIQIDRDTPWCCNPASETYWSM
jgi:hypothetical protein